MFPQLGLLLAPLSLNLTASQSVFSAPLLNFNAALTQNVATEPALALGQNWQPLFQQPTQQPTQALNLLQNFYLTLPPILTRLLDTAIRLTQQLDQRLVQRTITAQPIEPSSNRPGSPTESNLMVGDDIVKKLGTSGILGALLGAYIVFGDIAGKIKDANEVVKEIWNSKTARTIGQTLARATSTGSAWAARTATQIKTSKVGNWVGQTATRITTAAPQLGRTILSGAQQLGGQVLSGISTFGSGIARLAGLLGGTLLSGLRLAGQAVLFLGRALLMNPIGLAITGIAVAAYLIYRYWEPIKNFFGGLWQKVKTAFSGGVGSIAKLLLDWSPLGLLYKVFSSALQSLGIKLPASFSELATQILDGLINGLKAKFNQVKDTLVNLGQSIKGWFKQTLGISSPSRIFIDLGHNIGEGAQLGIKQTIPTVSRSSQALGQAAQAGASEGLQRSTNKLKPLPPALTGMRADKTAAAANPSGGLTIHFAPNIHLNANPAQGAPQALQQTLRLSMHELEQLLRRIQGEQQRRAYA